VIGRALLLAAFGAALGVSACAGAWAVFAWILFWTCFLVFDCAAPVGSADG
jgi:hypothetical protein